MAKTPRKSLECLRTTTGPAVHYFPTEGVHPLRAQAEHLEAVGFSSLEVLGPMDSYRALHQTWSAAVECPLGNKYGMNWDALLDILSDLSWRPPAKGYVLSVERGDDLMRLEADNLVHLIDVLVYAKDRWRANRVPFNDSGDLSAPLEDPADPNVRWRDDPIPFNVAILGGSALRARLTEVESPRLEEIGYPVICTHE